MSGTLPAFTGYQKFVVAVLAFLQFTIILDFMIISPLGAILMPELHITAAQFGRVVSAYAFSAGVAGFLAAGFADKFDRKKLLLFFYAGFLLGTLFCGLAPNYEFLLAARMVTGIFGGVIGSITLAIVTDLFAINMRGRVMGTIQTSFAASQILGIPAGLYFSSLWGWHAPFILIVVIGVAVGVVIATQLNPIDEHLKLQSRHNAFHHLRSTLVNPKFTLAFAATALLSTGGFMLMPFGSAFAVNNLKVDMEHLPMIYLVTGISAMFVGPIVGRLADNYSKFIIFVVGGIATSVMVVFYTHMGPSPLWEVILVNVILFASVFSRMIPAQALNSAIPDPAHRGSFMAVSSSIQQMSGGLSSLIAGLIVVVMPDGSIQHFEVIGYVLVGTVGISVVMMYFINRAVTQKLAVAPAA